MRSLKLEWLIETHVHADHLTAAPFIQERLGGKIGIGEKVTVVQSVFGKVFNEGPAFRRDGSQFDRLFKDGDRYRIGGLEAIALHTPGHTPACMVHVVGDAAFVGDTRLLPEILAATIIVAVLSLVDLQVIRRTWVYSKVDFAAMATTIVVMLTVGVETGIVAGVALSLVLFLWCTSTPHMAIVGQVPGTEHFRNIDRHAVITSPELLSLRVDESLYFANARFLEERICAEVARRPQLRNVVLMCPAVNLIDGSALESLEAIAERLRSAGVGFHLPEVKGPVMDGLNEVRRLRALHRPRPPFAVRRVHGVRRPGLRRGGDDPA